MPVKILCDVVACEKWNDEEQALTRKKRLKRARNNFKQVEQGKASFLVGTNDIDNHLVVLDSVQFYLK